jgi:DME family drug/metabolite transporter
MLDILQPGWNNHMRLKGYLLILLAAVLWGLIGPLSRIAFNHGMPAAEVAFWRTFLSWLLFAAHACWLRRVVVAPRDLPLIMAFGLAGIAGLFGFYVLAVREGGAALASVLLYTAPAWVAVMSFLAFKERMTGDKFTAVALTMAGVFLISLGPRLFTGSGGLSFSVAAIAFGLASGFSYALYYIFGKRYLDQYSTPTLFLYAEPVGALVLLPFFRFSAHPVQAWAACGVIALLATYGAYSLYYAGLRYLEATRAAVVATMEPVAANVMAYFMFGERFDLAGYVGAGFILLAVVVTVTSTARSRPAGAQKFLDAASRS